MRPAPWKRQRERGSAFAKRVILWIALHMGRRPARLLLYPISFYFLLMAPVSRRASRAFLARTLPRSPSWLDVWRHLHTFAATILDRVFLLSGRERLLDVRIHGTEAVEAYLQRGEGAILLGAHFGSFEVLRALGIARYAAPVHILMDQGHNETITRYLEALNPEVARRVIPLRGPMAILRVKEVLEENGLVGMLGDRVEDGHDGVACDFLGGTARLPAGPLRLASRLQTPVILFFGVYRGGRRYDIHFEHFADYRDAEVAAEARASPEVEVQRYADRLAAYVRAHPYNWFNFYEFWDQEDTR
ncbi:MAG: lipid A biosynthesis acyltransferase [Thiohalospira sp.]